MKKRLFVCLWMAVVGCVSLSAKSPQPLELTSPDGRLSVMVDVAPDVTWQMSLQNRIIMAKAPLALSLEKEGILGKDAVIKGVERFSMNEKIVSPVYKKSTVDNLYNQMTVRFAGNYAIEFRAFNTGVAYRFVTSFKKPVTVLNEQASFVFPTHQKAFVPYIDTKFDRYATSFESLYHHIPLSDVKPDSLIITPMLVDLGLGQKAVITEADLEDYPGMFLTINNNKDGFNGEYATVPVEQERGGYNNLQLLVNKRGSYIAKTKGTRTYPWRVVAISENDAELLNNDLVYLLAAPSRIADVSWIKPGKVAWDWWNDWNISGVDFRAGVNTETYNYYIDFAAQSGIEYVIMDEGWAYSDNLMNIVPSIDLKAILAHAQQKGVGIILWAGWLPLDQDMENVFRTYSQMGVKGFKIDFMDRDDQQVVNFYYRSAELAAKYKLMLDFHGAYKPTGLQRTWPNCMTNEGVKGLENQKWYNDDYPFYDVSIPYIRMLAGPMDYTPGAMRNANKGNFRPIHSTPMSQGTRCHQLAMYVVYESPLSMLCDNPSVYKKEPESVALMASIPTVFDETVALGGNVGESVVIARRKGDTWYVGALTNWDARTMTLDLSFLGDGEFKAEVFRDGINADREGSDYKREVITVSRSQKLDIQMAPGGGWVAVIKK
ncbi:glycoside hydrolase family 97 protein [Breznakibacter xylanolyticus]|nr:glycoside hydrolase family 97 protein [Breznakibacter xylanolyticus]